MFILCRQYVCKQALLERNIVASCSGISEISDTIDADDRDLRNVYQTIFIDGQIVCEYNGRACDDSWTGVGNICDSKTGTCNQRLDDDRDHDLRVFMDCLELLVAFIQAYVFTMLSGVFIGMSRQTEH